MTSMVRTAADILAEIEAAEAATKPAEPVEQPGVIRWEDPPPRDPRGNPGRPAPDTKYAPLSDELRSRPGCWALVYVGTKTKATSLANTIRFGGSHAFRPHRDFEAVTRTVGGSTRAYARYVGDEG